MPTYDYACSACGTFAVMRPIAQRDAPAACPACTLPAPRVFDGGPSLVMRDDGSKRRHAPAGSADIGSYPRMRHPASCRCC
ncbi:FmdB family zinc ribbon protein [Ramlibacter sp. MMS24-I3-19]|uniref:FmdB family zinc ribbon protein n=1 Tax=Ramlibacter sp. MMS24-I3-19 TaxID=3416606 RepID=UPI003D07CE5C